MKKIHWKRKKNEYHPRRNKGKIVSKLKNFKFKRILIVFFVLGILGMFYFAFGNSTYWKITEIEYVGIENLQKKELDASLNEFFNENIFFLKPSLIEIKLKDEFIQIKNVKAEKIYKNKIVVYIEEKVPHYIYQNFNGIYLFDKEGSVLKNTKLNDYIEYKQIDYELARGFGDLNGDYVEDRVFLELEPEQIEDFTIEEFNTEIKENILDGIINERQTNFNNRLDIVDEHLGEYGGFNVPVIKAWEEKIYEVGEIRNKEESWFLGQASATIEEKTNFRVLSSLWDGDLRLLNTINTGTEVIMSPSRDLDIQIEDLELIINKLEKPVEEVKFIDLSSTKVLIEYK